MDEPLSNLDAKLRAETRAELVALHDRLNATFVYVTHDQVEALTFAQEVVVMTRGRAVQVGSAEALFERPAHTFVGHFIGSPGMNFLPATVQAGHLLMGQHRLALGDQLHHGLAGTESLKLGIRPEHITVLNTPAEGCLPAQVLRWQDLGTSGLLTTQCAGEVVRVRLANHSEAPAVGQTVYLQVLSIHTCFYEQEALIA